MRARVATSSGTPAAPPSDARRASGSGGRVARSAGRAGIQPPPGRLRSSRPRGTTVWTASSSSAEASALRTKMTGSSRTFRNGHFRVNGVEPRAPRPRHRRLRDPLVRPRPPLPARLRHIDHQRTARIRTPHATSAIPNHSCGDGRSPRKALAKIATITTLSLSTGATFDASPICNARK